MIASDLISSTAHELSRALIEGKTSSEEITKAFFRESKRLTNGSTPTFIGMQRT